eukprot:TRINITY_DN962_c0_g1_i1.p1 TRINITY_DN962_c0_g1~~TRINITY_DN962_c0_g1_i1.p1  ORF type:complete len:893 (+),score=441.99 TRINITY_DN962_c0_g1_i1:72-2750(+)
MAALAAPAPAGELEEMSLEDVKKKMFTKLQAGGKLGALKAGVRQLMFADMANKAAAAAPAAAARKPLAQLAVDTVVLEYLKACGYHFSYSVFVSESNLHAASVNKITLEDAHGLLGNLDTTHECIRPLVHALGKSKQSGCVDAEVQAGEQDVARLDYKLTMIDEDYRALMNKPAAPSVERRMKQYQEEIAAEAKKTIAAEVERVRQGELSQLRLQEAAKYEKLLSEKLQDLAEKDRQLKHEVLMERYDVQAKQREVEHLARQFEKERGEHVQQAQAREASYATLQKDLLDKEALITELEVKLRGVTSDLRTSRQLCSDFQTKHEQYSHELIRVQKEQQADAERRNVEWAAYQKEKNNILSEYQHKILENDLALQNQIDALKRDHDENERARAAAHAEELRKMRDTLAAERGAMKAGVEREVRAQMADQVKQLQARQQEFCQAMVSTQMEIELQRNSLRKEAAEAAEYLQLGKRALPAFHGVPPHSAKRGAAAARRRAAEETLDLTVLSQQLLSDASEESSEGSPGHDDLLQAIREQAKRNYALLGEEPLEVSPQRQQPPSPAAAAQRQRYRAEDLERQARAAFDAYGYPPARADNAPMDYSEAWAAAPQGKQPQPQPQPQHVAPPEGALGLHPQAQRAADERPAQPAAAAAASRSASSRSASAAAPGSRHGSEPVVEKPPLQQLPPPSPAVSSMSGHLPPPVPAAAASASEAERSSPPSSRASSKAPPAVAEEAPAPPPPPPPSPPTAAEAAARDAICVEEQDASFTLARAGVEDGETAGRGGVAREANVAVTGAAVTYQVAATEYAETAARKEIAEEQEDELSDIGEEEQKMETLNPQGRLMLTALRKVKANPKTPPPKDEIGGESTPSNYTPYTPTTRSSSASGENPWAF